MNGFYIILHYREKLRFIQQILHRLRIIAYYHGNLFAFFHFIAAATCFHALGKSAFPYRTKRITIRGLHSVYTAADTINHFRSNLYSVKLRPFRGNVCAKPVVIVYSNPTNQQDTKQDLNQPIQSEGATAEKAVSMASGKA